MSKRILPGQLKIGMFICGFGGGWLDHPFWRTRFIVKTEADAMKIRAAAIPYIDIDEALGAVAAILPTIVAAPDKLPAGQGDACRRRRAIRQAGLLEGSHQAQVERLVAAARATMRGIYADARMGRAIRTRDTVRLIDEIAVAVARSPRTILDIVRLKDKDEYTFMHSVAVCALMINVAQFLRKNANDIQDYGQAGLLHDIGKMGISDHILNKPGPLTDEEFAVVRAHPEHGFRLLTDAGGVSDMALDVCRHHHEKQDGSGYPFSHGAGSISEVAALGGICDVYDALTSIRVYKRAWTPVEAVSAMAGWHGHFDPALLFVFMQSIAVFPAAMLVRLSSNRLGLTRAAQRQDTGPRVVAFYSTRDHELVKPEELYLADGMATDSIIGPAHAEQWDLRDWEQLQARLLARRRLASS